MSTCKDCTYIKEQAAGNDKYQLIDLGEHARNLKEFLQLRDSNPKFEKVKERGTIGIPCFVLEDGTVSFAPEKVGLKRATEKDLSAMAGSACNIDGSGC